jgi:hypothetical protein
MEKQIEFFNKPTTVVHCKREKYDVYIGRGNGSIWGNPFTHKENTLARFKVGSIKEAIEKYREWILQQPDLMAKIPELKGKILGCWCKDKNGNGKCHGDVLAEMANSMMGD